MTQADACGSASRNLCGFGITSFDSVRMLRSLRVTAALVVLVESDDLGVKAYLDNWTTINGIQASVTQRPARKPSAIGQVPSPRPRLGDLLLGKGMITEPQLKEGLSESYTSGELLGRIMLRHRWIFEDELARTLAEQLHLPYVNLRHTGVDHATRTHDAE